MLVGGGLLVSIGTANATGNSYLSLNAMFLFCWLSAVAVLLGTGKSFLGLVGFLAMLGLANVL